MIKKLSFLLVFFAFASTSKAQSDYEKQTMVFAKDLATKIRETKKIKIAVSDFLDNDENLTELGKAIAEEISVNILNEAKDSFKVVERSNLKAILKEQKLASTGLLDQLTVKKLGQIKVADAIIIGTITPFGNSFRITIKVLDTETGLSIAATSGNLSGTDDIKKLFDKKIILGNNTSSNNNEINAQKIESPKQEELPSSRNTLGCNGSAWDVGFGDFCFLNTTKFELVIDYKYYYGSNYPAFGKVNIKPNETKCLYNVLIASYQTSKFVIVKKEEFIDQTNPYEYTEIKQKAYDEGLIQSIKCKTVTYIIK